MNRVFATFVDLPPRLRDILMVAVVAVVTAMAVVRAAEPDAQAPDALAYTLALAGVAILMFHRRSPVATLFLVLAAGGVYHALDYPGGPPMIAFWVALYIAAVNGHAAIALVPALGVSAIGVAWRFFVEGDGFLWVAAEPVLAIAAVVLGDAVRARRLWAAEVNERLYRAEADKEREARLRVDEERLRIAHELHDVLAHTLAVVNVQAGVASEMLDDDPEATRDALTEMRRASREAMAELRATVGLLRDSTPAPRSPAPGMSELDRIVDGVRQAGIDVVTTVEGQPTVLSAAVDLAAFRVVQESLTNVVKHAAARSASVFVGYEPTGVVIEVTDDGRGANGAALSQVGYGVAGMRERVEALGGRLEAGGGPGAGFRVRAWLPAQAT